MLVLVDFVIDATASAETILPAVCLFCDDMIKTGYEECMASHDIKYGITVFYGKETPAKACKFKDGAYFVSDETDFLKIFDEVVVTGGSPNIKDNIVGGMKVSSQKLKESSADIKIMVVFSDSYVENNDLKSTGLIHANCMNLFLAKEEEIGHVHYNHFWGLPLVGKNGRVNHKLTANFYHLSDIFQTDKRKKILTEFTSEILKNTEE
jgi:hypothetical protein